MQANPESKHKKLSKQANKSTLIHQISYQIFGKSRAKASMSERASECLYLNMGYHSVPLANNLWALELAIGHTLRPVENPARALQGFWILLQLHFRSDSNKIKQTNKQKHRKNVLFGNLWIMKKEGSTWSPSACFPSFWMLLRTPSLEHDYAGLPR